MEQQHMKSWQIWSMSLGLLGINFGWGLQMANMSAIYEFLGAKPDQIPLLWLAAPVTGLLIQPIIGWLSDRTWCVLGRRRPYFLAGAILASLSLILMPLCHSLWMAALLLWVLDATVNVSMGPFRALVPDLLPLEQRQQGFMTQGILIAVGTVLASAFPWILQHFHLVSDHNQAGSIPDLVRVAFWFGAAIFLITIFWTVATTKEFPHALPSETVESLSVKGLFRDFIKMPETMRDLSWVMMFSWIGLFCMFLYFPIAVAHRVFHAEVGSTAYGQGIAFSGMCFAFYGVIFLLSSLVMPWFVKRFPSKAIYSVCLVCGAVGLISAWFMLTQWQALLIMVGVGIAFSAMQSLPYAMLANALPTHKLGTYMGLFNLFIVIPEILVALGFGAIMQHFLSGERHLAVMFGGVSMLIASIFALRIRLNVVQHNDNTIKQTNLTYDTSTSS